MELRYLGPAAWEDEWGNWAKFPFHGPLPIWWWGRDENNQRNYGGQNDVSLVGPIGGGRSQDTSQLSVFCPAASAGCARTFGWKAQDPWATRIFFAFADKFISESKQLIIYNQTAILGIKLPIEILVISGLASTSRGSPTWCWTTTAGRTSRNSRRRRRSLPAMFGWLRLWRETTQVLSHQRRLLAKLKTWVKVAREEPELLLLQTGMVTIRHVLKPVWRLNPLQLMPLMLESSYLNVIWHMLFEKQYCTEMPEDMIEPWLKHMKNDVFDPVNVSQVGLPSQDEQRGWIANCPGQWWQFLLGQQGQLKHHNFCARGVVRV